MKFKSAGEGADFINFTNAGGRAIYSLLRSHSILRMNEGSLLEST